jgi:hypothetical protein
MITGPDIIMGMILMLIGGAGLLIMLAIIWTAIRMINKIIYEVK